MNNQSLTPGNLPTSHFPFSPAVKISNFIFIPGQASIAKSVEISVVSFGMHYRRSFENVRDILTSARCRFNDVVQVRNCVGPQEDLVVFSTPYKEYFTSPYPARSTSTHEK